VLTAKNKLSERACACFWTFLVKDPSEELILRQKDSFQKHNCMNKDLYEF
jgi:hypothetical protein